jgi:hypothetical protein
MVRFFGDDNVSADDSDRSTFATSNNPSPRWKNLRKSALNLMQVFGRRRRNLSVSFASEFPTAVHYTLSRSEYTSHEYTQCWTTEWDTQHTFDKISYVMEKNALANGRIDRFCMRGLEHFDETTKELCTLHRGEALHAVLNTQAMQRKEGFPFCANTLADAYAEITQRCQKLASKKAEQDAIAARRYLSVRPLRAKRLAGRRSPPESRRQTPKASSSSPSSKRRHAHLKKVIN